MFSDATGVAADDAAVVGDVVADVDAHVECIWRC